MIVHLHLSRAERAAAHATPRHQDVAADAVDLTPHPADREALIERAIDAGVPVLSQKPLAVDLPTAERLVARAERAIAASRRRQE